MTSSKNDRKNKQKKIKARFGKFRESDIEELKRYVEQSVSTLGKNSGKYPSSF